MKKISFEFLQKDAFLKFLSEMAMLENNLLLEFDLEKDLLIAKTGSNDYMIRKDELKLSEVFRYNKESDISAENIKGRILFLIQDLSILVKTIKKFVSDGDILIFNHDDFNSVVNRRAARTNEGVTILDVPSVDVNKAFIKTKEKLKATFTILCGEIKNFVYFSDNDIEKMSGKDTHQFRITFDERELSQLLDLSSTFSNISDDTIINVKDNVVTFTNDNWHFKLNDSKVEGSGELKIISPFNSLKELGVSLEFNLFSIGDLTITFTNKEFKTVMIIGNKEEV